MPVPKNKNNLTGKQQIFVDAYLGNATEAARIAGYKQPEVQGYENLNKPHIAAAIAARGQKDKDNRIATREERQQFWSDVMRDTQDNEDADPTDISARLRASELLGKSQADFVERLQVEIEMTMEQAIIAANEAAK